MRLPDGPRSRVVLVGTSRYDDDRLPDLPAVQQNIEDLAAVLTSAAGAGIPARNCESLIDVGDPGMIWPVLQDAADHAADLLLVYYAGHGVLDPRGRLYLSLPGTARNSYRWTALDINHIRELMAESGADNRVLILDCCFSGRAYEAMADADPAALATGQVAISGTYTLTSTSANTPAHAPVGERYTAFTGALLELLDNGVPDGPPLLTLDDIYRDLNRTLRARGAPAPERKGTNNAGDLALLRNPARSGDESTAARRLQAAEDLFTRGIRRAELGRYEDAIEVYDQLIRAFRRDSDPAVRLLVAKTMRHKGAQLGQLGRSEAAIEVNDQLIASTAAIRLRRCG